MVHRITGRGRRDRLNLFRITSTLLCRTRAPVGLQPSTIGKLSAPMGSYCSCPLLQKRDITATFRTPPRSATASATTRTTQVSTEPTPASSRPATAFNTHKASDQIQRSKMRVTMLASEKNRNEATSLPPSKPHVNAPNGSAPRPRCQGIWETRCRCPGSADKGRQ